MVDICSATAGGGFTLYRQAILTAAVLNGGGLWEDPTDLVIPPATTKLTFFISYTRGAVAGQARFRMEWSNGTETDYPAVVIDEASLAVTQPEGAVSFYQSILMGPIPQDGDPVTFILEFDVPGGITAGRLNVAEVGFLGTPGTVSMSMVGLGGI